MFTADTIIDTIQTGKKAWVNVFVTNDAVKSAMVKFIDNQSEYTKKAVKATSDATATLIAESVKAMHEATKFDYVKFGEGIMKAYSAQTMSK